MSEPEVSERRLDKPAAELVQMATLALGLVLRGEVVGFILKDERGVCVVPKPGLGVGLMKVLAKCDWQTQVRLAEEWRA